MIVVYPGLKVFHGDLFILVLLPIFFTSSKVGLPLFTSVDSFPRMNRENIYLEPPSQPSAQNGYQADSNCRGHGQGPGQDSQASPQSLFVVPREESEV